MSSYSAFVIVTLTVLAVLIAYDEWRRKHAVKGSVVSNPPHFETEPHAEAEPLRRAA